MAFDFISRIMWGLGLTIQLIVIMGMGLEWMLRTVRMLTYVVIVQPYFFPYVLWYFFSPMIIRRVSYRSTMRTKRRNILRILNEEEAKLSAMNNRSGTLFFPQCDVLPADKEDVIIRNTTLSINPADGRRLETMRLPDSTIEKVSQKIRFSEAAGSVEDLTGVSSTSEGGADLTATLQLVLRSERQRRASLVRKTPATHQATPALELSPSHKPNATSFHGAFHEDGTGAFSGEINQNLSLSLDEGDPLFYPNQLQTELLGSLPVLSCGEGREHAVAPAEVVSDDGRVGNQTHEDRSDDDEEEERTVHNRAFLDIVLPVPLDSLIKTIDFVRNKKNLRRKKFPIVILISGGAWIIGSQMWSALISKLFSARGYVVFSPDYRNFPQATMEEMVLDVSDAISWVLKNAERYNGDLDDVTLIGQSAGAHLSMMSLVSQAQLAAYRDSPEKNGVPAPSPQAYNVPRYNPRTSIHHYIGLSGVYNISELADHFHRRGLYKSVLHQIAGGKSKIHRFSINSYFDERYKSQTGEVLPETIFDYLPVKMSFLHGDADKSAPVEEARKLVQCLRNSQRDAMLSRLMKNDRARQQQQQEEMRKSVSKTTSTELSFSGAGSVLQRGASSFRKRLDLQEQILPPSKGDLPLTPVELEFIVIHNASHTDPIVEEILLGGRSSCVDFVCDFERMDPYSPAKHSSRHGDDAVEKKGLYGAFVDGELPLSVLKETRPRLMRFASYVCPF